MRLEPGTKLGPYEIVAPIGAGGMGEVYRARDTRLGRDVAVKALPAAYATDADRLQRFEQEARAVGMLNHPNILAIYDVGSHEGSPFVVSEFLEGETLRDRLASGPLPLRKTTDYAVQLAHGLAAAHQKGIVHRDLKPENLFLTGDGRLKILDFGLAKLQSPTFDQGTATGELTAPGVVLGTMGYMSPEQVRGKPADARSDIFAAGAILYEMLHGRRAFQGESAVETMNAILKEDPPEVSESGRSIPAGLERVVSHCLEKNPEERFQSARDLAFNLEALSVHSGVTSTVAAAPAPKPRRWPRLALAAAVALGLLIAGYFAGSRIGVRRMSPPAFQRLTFRNGSINSARFAPDGQTVLYAAAWNGKPREIFSTRAGNPESRSLGLIGSLLAVSSSGELALNLGQGSGPRTLARVPMAGGAPRELAENIGGAAWGPNESLVVVRRIGRKSRLEFPIGTVLYETFDFIESLRVSPRGDQIAFSEANGGRAGVAVIDTGGHKRTLSSGWKAVDELCWHPSGEEIWFTATQTGLGHAIHAVTLAKQPAVRLVLRMAGPTVLQDIARDGRALITHHNYRTTVMCLAPGETKERDLTWLDVDSPVALSDDGAKLLFNEFGEASGTSYPVYLRKTDGSDAVRLGEGPALALSPDGKWVITISVPNASLVLLPTGAGESRTLKNDTIRFYGGAAWLPDGKRIVCTGAENERTTSRSWVLDATGGKPRPITPEGVTGLLVSPDGKFLLAIDGEKKRALYPVDGGEPRPVSGFEREDDALRWNSDGHSVYVVRAIDIGARVFLLDLATGQRQLWKELTLAEPAGTRGIRDIRLTPDGKSYVYSAVRDLTELYLVEGLK